MNISPYLKRFRMLVFTIVWKTFCIGGIPRSRVESGKKKKNYKQFAPNLQPIDDVVWNEKNKIFTSKMLVVRDQ